MIVIERCCKSTIYGWCSSQGNLYSDNAGNKYCIFHYPIELRKQSSLQDKFGKEVKNHIATSRKLSGCHIDFEVIFPPSPYPNYFDFKDCIFDYPIELNGFPLESFDASNAILNGLLLDNSSVKGAIFDKTKLRGKTSFKDCHFSSSVTFNNVEYDSLDFNRARFDNDVRFNSLLRIDYNSFYSDEALADVNFLDIIVDSNAKIVFYSSILKNAAFKPRGDGYIEFHQGKLKNVSFIDANISHCAFFGVDLSECFFFGADLSNARFFDCSFKKERTFFAKRIVLFEEEFVSNKPKYESQKYKAYFNETIYKYFTNSNLEETYCAFKNNFEDNKLYNIADEFHYGEMEMKNGKIALEKYQGKGVGNNLLKNLRLKLIIPLRAKVFTIYAWYKYISGYGTSYQRAFVSILMSLFVFTMLYMFSGLPNIKYEVGMPSNLSVLLKDFWASLFYSLYFVISPNSFREIVPTASSLTKAVFILELILIWTQFSLFILALRRHFKR